MKFQDPLNPREGTCITGYLTPFYVNNLEYEGSFLETSVSVVHRLDMNVGTSQGYLAFLLDIIPAGAAFCSLKKRFAARKPDDIAIDLFLLERCTPSPIGHILPNSVRSAQSIPLNNLDTRLKEWGLI